MKTKTIDISKWQDEFPGKDPVIVLKKLNYFEYTELQEEATDIKIIGNQQIVNPSLGKGKRLLVLKSIKEAPFKVTEKAINELPFDLGELLFEEADDFNDVNPKK